MDNFEQSAATIIQILRPGVDVIPTEEIRKIAAILRGIAKGYERKGWEECQRRNEGDLEVLDSSVRMNLVRDSYEAVQMALAAVRAPRGRQEGPDPSVCP